MKIVVFISVFLLTISFSLCQSTTDCQLGSAETDTIELTYLKSAYIPSQSTPIKYVKVNFHYMLRIDGSGNFTETDDGDGDNSFNGYMHAMNIVKAANTKLAQSNIYISCEIGNNLEISLTSGNTITFETGFLIPLGSALEAEVRSHPCD